MIKTKKHEKLTETNISHVIELLRAEKPITKKEACSILNISYNTTRLANIIQEHEDTMQYRELRKNQNKGKGLTESEKKQIIEYYLEGDNIMNIAKQLYRSPAFIKSVIERLGIPQKLAESDYKGRRNALLPEQCVKETFEVGEKVWSPRDNKFAEIVEDYGMSNKYESHSYRLWVLEPCDTSKTYFPHLDGTRTGYTSFALAYELGSLEHIKEYL
jgi:transposase